MQLHASEAPFCETGSLASPGEERIIVDGKWWMIALWKRQCSYHAGERWSTDRLINAALGGDG